MTRPTRMIETYPGEIGVDHAVLARAIEQCFECAQTCTACADACLNEPDVAALARCIRLNLDCADICETTGRLLSRHTGEDPGIARLAVQTCAVACRGCGDECARHAGHHPHCQVCAEACRRCEQACQDLLAAIGAGSAGFAGAATG